MKFRLHRGGLKESMKTCVDIHPTLSAIYNVLRKTYPEWVCHIRDLSVSLYYCGERDNRTGWEKTYIVTIKKLPVGFTDGPIERL
jgi:hypothetical protein